MSSRDNRSNSSRPFYRVKLLNGMSSTTAIPNDVETSRLLNILNWSSFDHHIDLSKLPTAKKNSSKDETESKSKSTINTVQISIELQRKMLTLKSMCIDPSGRLIDYRQLRTTTIYNDLCQVTKHLTTINLDNVTENERKTLFINLFNALTIHGITKVNHLPKSILDLNQFGKTTSYKVGAHVYSLDDIEHGILRGNKPHCNCTQRHLTFNDPRTKYSMRRCDARIHFALNFGARSCPQIAIFSSSTLEKALNMATTSYCNSDVDIQLETNEVHLSKLFLWYRNDFGRSDIEILRWITKYIDEPKRSFLQTLVDQQTTKDGFRLCYKPFDWMLNDFHHSMEIE